MKTFDVLDISGDAGLRAYGQTLQELFVNAAMGMYSFITDPEAIREERDITVDIESLSLDGLLVAWLNELIFHFDAYGFVGKRIVITEITPSLALPRQGGGDKINALSPRLRVVPTGGRGLGEGEACTLKGIVSGEDFDPERHERRLLIKAATYHMLKIGKEDDQWSVSIIFDI